MAVGDRIQNPDYNGYSTHEVTDESPAQGLKQAAQLVKIVGDDGSTSSPATAANQTTGNTSLASIDTNLGAKADSAASTDTGTFSLIALVKRALQSLTSVSSKLTGAANYANGQVTAASASAQLVAARATRRCVLVRNLDAANSAYVGAGAVTSANGFLLKAGESISIETTAAVNCIRATADVALAYFEIYD